jgi:probable rRNA maturation factor
MASGLQAVRRARAGRLTGNHNPGPLRERTLALRNRQHLRRVDLRLLRRIARALLCETWPEGGCDLAIHVVAASEITRLNETFLQHKGLTDVITFDYADRAGQASRLSPRPPAASPSRDRRDACPPLLHGEIFVCLDEALSQSRRFHTIWQSELVRYVVHGVLHLLGYDDQRSLARRKMKRAEDDLVHSLDRQFDFRRLGKRPAGAAQAHSKPEVPKASKRRKSAIQSPKQLRRRPSAPSPG